MKRGDGYCTACGAPINMSNCAPPENPCEQCGQCSCLAGHADWAGGS